MKFRQILHGSKEYEAECELRNEILRIPHGLSLYDEDLDAERTTFHFGLFDENDSLIGCVIATPRSESRIQIRQMAVRPKYRGHGLGRKIMEGAENFIRDMGFTEIFLHARDTVTGFYEKLGYQVVGEEFIEVTIPHREMVKSL